MIKKLVNKLNQFQGFLTVVTVIAIIGYSLYQASLTLGVMADPAMVEAKKKQSQATIIKFDRKGIEAINQLTTVEAETNLHDVGKTDPFSP